MCRQNPVGKTIGEVEKLTGIPKRMLKYYIERKIIVPGGKSASGYWLYTDEDVEKLRLVYLCRELQCRDSDIRALLAAPQVDWQTVLDRQIDHLTERRSQAEDRLLTAELVRYRCRTGRAPGEEDGTDLPVSRLEAYFEPGRSPRLPEEARRGLCRDLYGTFAETIGADRPFAPLRERPVLDPAAEAAAARAQAAVLCTRMNEHAGLTPEEVLFALRLALCLSGMELLLDVLLGRKGAVRSLAGAVQDYCDTQNKR